MSVYDIVKNIVYKYLNPPIIAVCLLANVCCFVVFSRKCFRGRGKSVGFYSRVLLLGDLFGIGLFIIEMIMYGLDYDITSTSLFTCKSLYYVMYALSAISPWMITLISFDRMVNIACRNRFKFARKAWFRRAIPLVIAAYSLIYYSEMIVFADYKHFTISHIHNESNQSLFDYEYNESVNMSHAVDESTIDTADGSFSCIWSDEHASIIQTMDTINFIAIPFLLMLIFSTVSLRAIYKSRRKAAAADLSHPRKSSVSRVLHPRDVHFAITSLMLNVIFLLMTLPCYIFYFFTLDPTETTPTQDMITSILDTLFYMHHGSLFFINFIFNKTFRKEFLGLIIEKTRNSSIKELLSRTRTEK
jgi:hypothetical protein